MDLKSDVAEITVLSSGSYGESILIHLGNNEWIIVDSCVNPRFPNEPLPLKYLESINVDPLNIKIIICTHWHDDHIRGLATVFEACKNAEFCIARAHDKDKFRWFISSDNSKPLNSSTKEFVKCLLLLKSRKIPYREAVENRIIFNNSLVQVLTLSPSDFTNQKFDLEIGSLITDYGKSNKRIPYSSPNNRSVVLYLKLGYHRVILGADLENVECEDEGWQRIIKAKVFDAIKVSLFKIPHHGSENGYCSELWDSILDNNPVSKITPWNLGGSTLPTDEMIDLYKQKTNKLYLIKSPTSNKQKSRDRQIEKLIKEMLPALKEIKFSAGIIRSRIDMTTEKAEWVTETLSGSTLVS